MIEGGDAASDFPVLVFFHAHPDDEAIVTGSTVAHLVEAGCRVAVPVATSGELRMTVRG